jgi:hypothetical protein
MLSLKTKEEDNMDNMFPFVRGELLTKVNKFAYIEEATKWRDKIDEKLCFLKASSQSPEYVRLMRQRQRLVEKIETLQKSIEEDISASKQ